MIGDIFVEEGATSVANEKRLRSLSKKKERNLTGDPGRSLITEIQLIREQQAELTRAVLQLCTLMGERKEQHLFNLELNKTAYANDPEV